MNTTERAEHIKNLRNAIRKSHIEWHKNFEACNHEETRRLAANLRGYYQHLRELEEETLSQ